MLKVTILKGLPGSGKSTIAVDMVKDSNGKTVRINKDSLRKMSSNTYFGKLNDESLIDRMRDRLILETLESDKNVVIDDTNLHPSIPGRIRQLVGDTAVVEERFVNTPLHECIRRDLLRERSVGERVIRNMYQRYLAPLPRDPALDEGLPEAVIVDIDGTLCLIGDRDPYDASKCHLDTPNPAVMSIIQHYPNIILCSGRQELHRPETEKWLEDHDIHYINLLLRQTDDRRRDAVVKEEIYHNHIEGKYNITFVLDDRQQVVDMWRSVGLRCLQVAPGDF